MECLFCKIIKGEVACCKVFENDDFIAILDIMPVNLGHTLMIPKKHFRNILDTPDDIAAKVYPLLKQISCGLKKELNCDGLNIIQNIEPSGGQEVFHSHIHIIPRFADDGFKFSPKKKKYSCDDDMMRFAKKISNTIYKCIL